MTNTLKISSIDAYKALKNETLIKNFRKLTIYADSGLNKELDRLIKISKTRKPNAKMVMAHVENNMVGWCLLSREPSTFNFTNGQYSEYLSKEYTLLELFVSSKHRGMGIGTALIKRAKLLFSITKGQPFAIAPHSKAGVALFKKIDPLNKFYKLDGLFL